MLIMIISPGPSPAGAGMLSLSSTPEAELLQQSQNALHHHVGDSVFFYNTTSKVRITISKVL
jgi:hypothetical protein